MYVGVRECRRNTSEARVSGKPLACRPSRAALLALPVTVALAFVAGCDDSTTSGKALSGTPTTVATATPNGNGIDKLSPAAILDRAKKASSGAKSVHARGKVHEDGQTFAVDLRIASKRSAIGDITMDRQSVKVILMGSAAYLKGDDKFLRAMGGQGAVALLSGKYLKFPADDKDFRDLVSLMSTSKLFSELRPEGKVTKGEQARINGRPAIALIDATGCGLYVATEGEPHILRVSAGKGCSESLDFLAYNEKVEVQPPPRDVVVDVDALK